MKNKKELCIAASAIFAASIMPSFGATGDGLCSLIGAMQGVFKTLRILAFLGAGFILANMAWELIKGGDGKTSVVDTLKAKGIPMIVGFALLFGIGIAIGFLANGQIFSCPNLTTGW
jgi:hypothetical protein